MNVSCPHDKYFNSGIKFKTKKMCQITNCIAVNFSDSSTLFIRENITKYLSNF